MFNSHAKSLQYVISSHENNDNSSSQSTILAQCFFFINTQVCSRIRFLQKKIANLMITQLFIYFMTLPTQ